MCTCVFFRWDYNVYMCVLCVIDVCARVCTCVCAAGEAGAYDPTGQASYREACGTLGVVPASYALRHLQSSELTMMHHGLGPQVGAVAPANHGPSWSPDRPGELVPSSVRPGRTIMCSSVLL